ncbi:phage holin family protein [Canibacter zhoujuaniae]|uniref:phage holin family protein n=1 Tax=Canibacter zhoujuaniae TaxID=2708343 RepID=UPI0014201C76|nr:phage holin family protein [Canibacter zhoujuaniae]
MFSKKRSTPSTLALLTRVPAQAVRLAKAEIGNAKEEVSGRIKNLVIGIVLVVVALVILFWTTAVLLAAAVAGIAEGAGWPVWLSALVIGGAGVITILLLAVIAVVLFKRGNPVPHKTLARIKSDLDAAGEVKKNSADKMKPQPGKTGTETGKQGVWR